MKYITFLVYIFFTISCKKEVKENLINQKIQENKTKINFSKKESTCEEKLLQFVLNSSLKNYFKSELKVKIEEINENNLKINLFVLEQNNQNTIGWLIMDLQKKELLDITNDIESPEKLKYSKKLWDEIIRCYYPNRNRNKTEVKLKCNDLGGDFENGFVEECISNENIDIVYNYFKTKYFEDGNKFLESLPKKDTFYSIENVQVSYKLKKNNIKIDLVYSGGNNEISILKIKTGTKIIQRKFPD